MYDFLFEYYPFRPSHLVRWSPGAGVVLAGAEPGELDWAGWYSRAEGGCVIPSAAGSHRTPFVRWLVRYLEAVGRREPFVGCFGLHEWAMVYRTAEVRHRRVPLRLSPADTDAVVEAGTLCCTHFDAYRFFTPGAAPRNRTRLTRQTATAHDQPGCVHVTMDLYKWAFKLAPLLPAELTADAFELAVAARELDMRASPYDLRGFGFAPIPIETRAGREEYVAGQRELARRAAPVRGRLLDECRRLLILAGQAVPDTVSVSCLAQPDLPSPAQPPETSVVNSPSSASR